IDAFTRLLDVSDGRRVESLGELILQTPAFPVFVIPLRLVGGNLRFVRRHFAEHKLANREDGQLYIAHQTHIKFAALDIFLGNGVAVVFLMNKSDPLTEIVVGLDERRLRNAVGRFFFYGLYQDRKLELLGSPDALAARNDDEMGHMDSVIVQNLFRNAFVLAKRKAGRTAAGKGPPLHFEK